MPAPERSCERCNLTTRFNQTYVPHEGGYRLADVCPRCRRDLEALVERFVTDRQPQRGRSNGTHDVY